MQDSKQDKLFRCSLYVRVSTSDKGQSTDDQLIELREYAARRQWQVVGEYTDHGVSGALDRRPALDKLMAEVRKRRTDGVVCCKLDRLGRSMKHLVNLLGEFEALVTG